MQKLMNIYESVSTNDLRKICCALLLLLMASSFADIRFSVGGKAIFTLSIFELVSYLLLLFLFGLYISNKYRDRFHNTIMHGQSKWLLIYGLWALVAALIYTGDPSHAVQLDFRKLLPG